MGVTCLFGAMTDVQQGNNFRIITWVGIAIYIYGNYVRETE
jgi:hypothetical protein